MRPYLLPMIALLSLALAGCGNDRYAIERSYWRALKQAGKIYTNPDATPPNELDAVVNTFRSFTEKYPNTRLAVDADFTIARLYLTKKEYDSARKQLRSIIERYTKLPSVCADAQFLIGRSYEVSEEWGRAIAEYRALLKEYTLTPRGIGTPMYLAQFYKARLQPDKMMNAYREAIAHYRELSSQHPGTVLSYNLDFLTVDCYAALKEWSNALSGLEAIVNTYSGKARIDTALFGMAAIYAKEMKLYDKAKESLERLLKEYPKSPLARPAAAMLKEIEKRESR